MTCKLSTADEFNSEVKDWKNEDLYNELLHSRFTKYVNKDPLLKEHRDWIERNQHGFGDRAFHYLWELLVWQMPEVFTFLEVGVFKGQVTSLVALLAEISKRRAIVVGVTTLENTRDERCQYPEGDYLGWINLAHAHFMVQHPILIKGKSSDRDAVGQSGTRHDIVYIDASHDYKEVAFDILNYGPKVRDGGFLVMDDASIGRLHVGSLWPGLEDVARAVKDHLDNDPGFKFLIAVGHLNIFQRVKA